MIFSFGSSLLERGTLCLFLFVLIYVYCRYPDNCIGQLTLAKTGEAYG